MLDDAYSPAFMVAVAVVMPIFAIADMLRLLKRPPTIDDIHARQLFDEWMDAGDAASRHEDARYMVMKLLLAPTPMRFGNSAHHLRTSLIVMPAQVGIHPTVDTGLRRYDKKLRQAGGTSRSGH